LIFCKTSSIDTPINKQGTFSMGKKQHLSAELRNMLEQWAEDALGGIGIFKNRYPDFERLKEKAIEQLRSVYSDITIDMFLRTEDNRRMDSPDGFARITGPCGDTMEIYLKADSGVITDSSFQTDGCNPSKASGGMVAQMAKGKSIAKIKKLTAQDILDALGGLPEESEHCATLAVDTLKAALEDIVRREKAAGKRQRLRL
jgi:nitrogen fixation NifU-like protein